jgi:hypothetical protein
MLKKKLVTLTEYGNVARIISIRLLFWESESKYFGLGKIKEDQVIDYAKVYQQK